MAVNPLPPGRCPIKQTNKCAGHQKLKSEVTTVPSGANYITVGKNARSSKTKDREPVNFFGFMDVSYGIN